MGREIRKVPANWQHPKTMMPYGYDFQPKNNEGFKQALEKWTSDNIIWIKGEHPDQLNGTAKECPFEEWCGSVPEEEFYLSYDPANEKLCTHFQVYQTVSEGTPVTPVFATLQELEDWLVDHGEGAGTRYNRRFSRSAAHAFCQSGYAPSMIITGGVAYHGIESADK